MISIKEIAKLSGVSIATVSKIVNNKASDISQDTIDRVLEIVKKYNYTPYGIQRNSPSSKTFTIGILVKKLRNSFIIVEGLISLLNEKGYSLMVFDSKGNTEIEKMNISKILTKNLDGLIWETVLEDDISNLDKFKDTTTKIIFINNKSQIDSSYSIDYEKMSFQATQSLIDKGHADIACLIKENSVRGTSVLNGYKQCLFENNIKYKPHLAVTGGNIHLDNETLKTMTGVISSHYAITQLLLSQLSSLNISVPEEVTIISLRDDYRENSYFPYIPTIKMPNYEFGEFLGNQIVGIIEQKTCCKENFITHVEIENSALIEIPMHLREPKILVIGSINVDNILHLKEFPTPGNTQMAIGSLIIPGGKALNQAIGIERLGKSVRILGKVGKDDEANHVLKTLTANNIDTSSIISDVTISTGKAYISINKDGESTITITKGANNNLTKQDIKNNIKLFENTSYCLLQSEIPLKTVAEAARLAKVYNATTILKPATISKMDDSDYKNIDIFVPNEKEAYILSKLDKVEDQADYFLSKGIKTVIITLGHNGCYLKTNTISKYFPIFDIDVVDTTGASDAFISTLAVKLYENYNIEEAIKIATISAGYCISKFGVSNSLIDKSTLESYLNQNEI